MNTSVEGYRLSPQQRRIWHTNRASLVQTAVLVEGAMNREALVEALAELVRRHEVLRTVFHELPGLSLPVQVVLEAADIPWTIAEEELAPSDVERRLEEFSCLTFDIQKGPLLRAALFPLARDRAVVVLQISALLGDSDARVLIREWFHLYDAIVREAVLDAEEEEISYAVIAEWLNQLLEDEESEAGRAFWQRQRVESVSPVEAPWSRKAGAEAESSGQAPVDSSPAFAQGLAQISGELWTSLVQMANLWGVSASDLVLVAWRAVWQRVTGAQQVMIGIACDGRTDEAVEAALGVMTRFVPWVSSWSKQERVEDAVQRVNRYVREAQEWQESWSWELLPSEQQARFQIGFAARERFAELQAGGVRVSLWQERAQGEPLDVLLSCLTRADGAELSLQADAHLWPQEAVAQWLGAVVTMVEQMVSTGALELGALRYWQDDLRASHMDALAANASDAVAEADEWLYQSEDFNNLWRPVQGVQLRVVDETGEHVPLGAVGVLEARHTASEEAWNRLGRAQVWPGGWVKRFEESTAADRESAELIAPRNEIERTLARIWADVLGVAEIDVRDSFFDLGGHSLLATQVVMRMRERYGVEFPMRIVFQTKTLEALAHVVEQAASAVAEVSATTAEYASIPRLPEQELYVLSPSQERLWFAAQLSPTSQFGSGFYYVIEEDLHTESFTRAIAALTERHAILRTTIVVQDGIAYQRPTPGLQPSVVHHDLLGQSEGEQMATVRERVLEVWTTPFDLGKESFFRIELFRLSERKSMLFLCAHHIGYDGWGVRLFIRDLNAFYTAYRQGDASASLPDVVPFFDAAAWMQKRLADGELQGQLDYWLAQLQDDLPPPSLPSDAGEWTANPLDVRMVAISQDTTARLQELAQGEGSSLYATVLSGVMAWLSLVSRESLVTVGATMSGRTHPELEEAFGPLINPVAMRTDLSGNPTAREIVARAAQTSFDAYANQDYPFDLLWQELRKRGAKARALYSVILIGQNVTDGAIRLDGVRLQPQPLTELLADRLQVAVDRLYGGQAATSSAYDLVMSMSEVDGGIVLEANYATEKFKPETVDRFLAQIVRVLEQFASDAEARLSQLNVEEPDAEDAWDELF